MPAAHSGLGFAADALTTLTVARSTGFFLHVAMLFGCAGLLVACAGDPQNLHSSRRALHRRPKRHVHNRTAHATKASQPKP